MSVHYPPVFINEYLKEKVSEYFSDNPFDGQDGDVTIPFFPTTPTDLEALISSFPASNGMFAVYDRMFKYRRSPFPHIKSEQLLYYFYKMHSDPVGLLLTTQVIQDLLDREDESAQELNAWIRAKQESQSPIVDDNGNPMPRVFFHKIKVYQLEETRDIVDFGTARTYAGNKIIIDYDWHKS
jgi:hypothetical protein